jgi:biofilm PGA synthesis N-glycosyltransferase PgaC
MDDPRRTPRLTVIVPFLDEADHLPRMLHSLAAQERRPDELVLVDDGSEDGSARIAAAFAAAHDWAHVERRPAREPGRDRLAGGAALQAFTWGVEQAAAGWDVVAKLDADVQLTPRTFAAVLDAFEADARLGMAGPYISAHEDGMLVRQRCRPEHVEGEVRCYTRACYEAVAPLPAMLGWDTIDEVRARLRGFRTASIAIAGGDPVHMRPMGGHDGRLRGHRRWGTCAWAYGEHPLHVVAVGLQRLGDRPRILGGLSYVAGYALAAARGAPRAETEVRRVVRRDGLTRVLRRAAHPVGLATKGTR